MGLALVCGVRRQGLPPGNAVAVIVAKRTRRLLGQRVAIPLAVGRPHEGSDDVEVPLGDLPRFPPEVGEAEVDVELEEVDPRGVLGHATRVEKASDDILEGWERFAWARPDCMRRADSRRTRPGSRSAATAPSRSASRAD